MGHPKGRNFEPAPTKPTCPIASAATSPFCVRHSTRCSGRMHGGLPLETRTPPSNGAACRVSAVINEVRHGEVLSHAMLETGEARKAAERLRNDAINDDAKYRY